jgi:LuxR family transcriptional regulator
MEMWKESQLKQLTFAREIETAYPILLRFAQNIGFNFLCHLIDIKQSER